MARGRSKRGRRARQQARDHSDDHHGRRREAELDTETNVAFPHRNKRPRGHQVDLLDPQTAYDNNRRGRGGRRANHRPSVHFAGDRTPSIQRPYSSSMVSISSTHCPNRSSKEAGLNKCPQSSLSYVSPVPPESDMPKPFCERCTRLNRILCDGLLKYMESSATALAQGRQALNEWMYAAGVSEDHEDDMVWERTNTLVLQEGMRWDSEPCRNCCFRTAAEAQTGYQQAGTFQERQYVCSALETTEQTDTSPSLIMGDSFNGIRHQQLADWSATLLTTQDSNRLQDFPPPSPDNMDLNSFSTHYQEQGPAIWTGYRSQEQAHQSQPTRSSLLDLAIPDSLDHGHVLGQQEPSLDTVWLQHHRGSSDLGGEDQASSSSEAIS